MTTKTNTENDVTSSSHHSTATATNTRTEEESMKSKIDVKFSAKTASHQQMDKLKSSHGESHDENEAQISSVEMTEKLGRLSSTSSMPNNPLLSQTQSVNVYPSTSVQELSHNASVCPNPIRQQHHKQQGSNLSSTSCQVSQALPTNLRHILQEVAKTGRCAALAWDYPNTYSVTLNQEEFHRMQPADFHAVMENSKKLKQDLAIHKKQTASKVCSGRKRPLNCATSSGTFSYIQSPQQIKVNHHHHGNDVLDQTIRKIDLQDNRQVASMDTTEEQVSCQILQIDENKFQEKTDLDKKTPRKVNGVTKGNGQGNSKEISIMTNKMLDNYEGMTSHVSMAAGGSTPSLTTGIATKNQPIKQHDSKPVLFPTLRDVLKISIALVLDYSYKHQGGYKVNQAERKRYQSFKIDKSKQSCNLQLENGLPNLQPSESKSEASQQAQFIFMERRNRLLKMLSRKDDANCDSLFKITSHPLINDNALLLPEINRNKNAEENVSKPTMSESTEKIKTETIINRIANAKIIDGSVETITISDKHSNADVEDGPPFTIQRIAEVLVMPERYYTQTHKLCNALEKLLLVTSPNDAFGNFSGDEIERRKEERDSIGITDERNREGNLSDQRQRRPKRRASSLSSEGNDALSTDHLENEGFVNKTSGVRLTTESHTLDASTISHNSDFDHEHKFFSSPASTVIGGNGMLFQMINNGSTVSTIHDKYISMQMEPSSISGVQRQMIESLAPSNFSNRHESQLVAHDTNLQNMKGVSDEIQHRMKADADASMNIQENLHTSVMFNQHPVARPPSPILFTSSSPPSHGLNSIVHEHHRTTQVLQSNPTSILAGDGSVMGSRNSVQMEILIDPSSSQSQPQNVSTSTMSSNLAVVAGSEMADLDGDQGRSSASNSDIDSESDDVSLDDSASDRSDGSDSGSGIPYHEPFNAARVMALNRMQQQQQRREYFLQSRSLANIPNYQQHDSYRPQPDLEYQSGDSLDSMIAEDSGESDSSSSDVND